LLLPDCVDTQTIEKERLIQDEAQMTSLSGIVLAGPEEINLLPQEVKTQKIELVQKVSLRLIAVTLGAVFLLLSLIFNFQIHDYKKRLRTAQIHLETIADIRGFKQKIDTKTSLINTIQKNKVPVEGLLKLFSTIIGQNIVLNELSLDQGRQALSLKGVVSVTGSTAESTLTDFIKRIKMSPFFREANLIASQNTAGVQEFEIKCDLAR
jgi:type II secretory pathway component PulL